MKVVLRADASPGIGGGHVARSLTLAEAFHRAGCSPVLVGTAVSNLLRGRGEAAEAVFVRDLQQDVPLPESIALDVANPDLVVVDGYHFSGTDFARLDATGVPYVVIDDNGTTEAAAPLAVVNQNPHASPSWYDHLLGDPLRLIGLPYALVRSDVTRLAPASRAVDRIFVGFGASDVAGLAHPVASGLARLGYQVVLSEGVFERAQSCAGKPDIKDCEGVVLTPPEAYAESLAGCSLAVIGAGSTIWEVAALGLPAVVVVVAENQVAASFAAQERGFVERVDCRSTSEAGEVVSRSFALAADRRRCDQMARLGAAQVDGRGADRVVASILQRMSERALEV